MAQTRTVKQAVTAAALAGFATNVSTFDGGQTIRMVQQVGKGLPEFRVTLYWGDDEWRAVEAIDNFVAEHRHRREDDPRVQHEGVYVERY